MWSNSGAKSVYTVLLKGANKEMTTSKFINLNSIWHSVIPVVKSTHVRTCMPRQAPGYRCIHRQLDVEFALFQPLKAPGVSSVCLSMD